YELLLHRHPSTQTDGAAAPVAVSRLARLPRSHKPQRVACEPHNPRYQQAEGVRGAAAARWWPLRHPLAVRGPLRHKTATGAWGLRRGAALAGGDGRGPT